MDLFELVASLGIDTTGFIGGISGALKWALGQLWDFEKEIVSTGANTQKRMSAVQAVLGAEEGTVENMERLYTNAKNVAKDSVFTVEEAADAYYYMGMAGWKTEQMLSGLPGIINLAAASEEDLASVSDIVTDSLTAFGLGAGQSAHFADVLAATATNSNTDVARMGQTFRYVGSVADSLGYSIEDVASSIGIMANAGIKGSMAGTSLRNIFTRLATNAGATQNSMGALEIVTEKLGVDFYDAAGKARPWGEFLTDVREKWRTLDPEKAAYLTELMGAMAVEGADATEVLAGFTDSLDDMQTEWNGLTSEADRESFVQKYGKLFEALDISMYDSNGKLKEFNTIASEARIKLGGLNDEESTFYANKIGNLRGMSAWLALMTATDEDWQQIEGSIRGANGAAQEMANTRLDNLWGDWTRLNSVFDVVKNNLFDLQDGPLRTVAKSAVEGLDRVNERLQNEGWQAGLDQLSIELTNWLEQVAPIIEQAASVIAPAVAKLFGIVWDNVWPLIEKAVIPFFEGLLDGIVDYIPVVVSNIATKYPGIGKLMASFLGVDYASLVADYTAAGFNAETTGDVLYDGVQNARNELCQPMSEEEWQNFKDGTENVAAGDPIKTWVSLTADYSGSEESLLDAYHELKRALTVAQENDALLIEMNGDEYTIEQAEARFMDLERILRNSYNYTVDELNQTLWTTTTDTSNRVANNLQYQLFNAGLVGSESISSNLVFNGFQAALGIGNMLVNAFSNSGMTGGVDMANNLYASVDSNGMLIENTLANTLGNAGSDAGNTIVNGIQSALNFTTFAVNVVGTLSTIFGGGAERFAKAQHTGYILHGATMFGMSSSGKALIGGENGAEAVVGTGELSELIQDAVNNSAGGDNVTFNIYQQPGEDEVSLANRIERILTRQQRQRKAAYA